MKKIIFSLACAFVILVESSNAQTSRRLLSSFGVIHYPFSKESPSRNDDVFKNSWNSISMTLGYSVDKWPVEIFYSIGIRNKTFGKFERDVIYSMGHGARMSKLFLNYGLRRVNYGLNFYLFKHDAELIMQDPKEGYSSTRPSLNRKKKKIINPFVGIGVSKTRFSSSFMMQTVNFETDDEGEIASLDFSKYESSTLLLNLGFEIKLYSSRNDATIPYPSWNFLTYYFRYTANYQNIPTIYTHTSSTLGQDFMDNYQPYMDSYSANQMIKVPLTNWTHFFELALVMTLNSKASKKRTEIWELLQDNQTESQTTD